MSESGSVWSEENSAHFVELGKAFTPRRDELAAAFCDLIPAAENDSFTAAELGTGAGWLSAAILERYPRARLIGLDGSSTMRDVTRANLAAFGDRAEIGAFRLEETDWIDGLPEGLRAVVSSLAIHHLKGTAKRDLFGGMHAKLESGGALLICDVIEPENQWARRHFARAWDADVARQSRELFGDDSAYRAFVADQWNLYEYPVDDDDIDFPSTLGEQLAWLREVGFRGVDVFWARAGHALFGGYRT